MLPLSNALSKEEVLPPRDAAPLAQLAGANALQQTDMDVASVGCGRADYMGLQPQSCAATDGAQ